MLKHDLKSTEKNVSNLVTTKKKNKILADLKLKLLQKFLFFKNSLQIIEVLILTKFKSKISLKQTK